MANKNESFGSANQFPIKLLQCNKAVINNKIKPYHIQLIPTNRCNGNCPWCSCKDVDRNIELSIEEISNILHYFHGLGTKAITITGGGEPTIHKNFITILKICNALNLQAGMTTNGININDAKFAAINETLTWMRLSITDTIGNYPVNRVFDTCLNLPKVDVGISFTVADEVNIETAKAICEMSEKLSNLTHIRFVSNILNPNKATMLAVKSVCEKYPKAFFQERSDYTKGDKDCYISLLKPLIGADGYIYPCCGVQYATDELRVLPESFKMCYWPDFHKTKHFNGSVCNKCYYSDYNGLLIRLVKPLEHKDFL